MISVCFGFSSQRNRVLVIQSGPRTSLKVHYSLVNLFSRDMVTQQTSPTWLYFATLFFVRILRTARKFVFTLLFFLHKLENALVCVVRERDREREGASLVCSGGETSKTESAHNSAQLRREQWEVFCPLSWMKLPHCQNCPGFSGWSVLRQDYHN